MRFKRILKNPFLWAFLIGIASLHLVKQMALARRHAPEPLVHVGDWQLTDQNGRTFSNADLKGKVVVADFFFTSCPTVCPKLTNAMKEVFARFDPAREQVAFLSITVDPEVDTPERLTRFLEENGIQTPHWHALTGKKADIYRVVVEKMRLHVGEKEPVAGTAKAYDVPHLAQLALFDQNGDLRGLFATEPLELAALVRAAKFLLEK